MNGLLLIIPSEEPYSKILAYGAMLLAHFTVTRNLLLSRTTVIDLTKAPVSVAGASPGAEAV